jgi:hypothetical protein
MLIRLRRAMRKEKVCLFGASGTMGNEALKELWAKRDRYDVVLLLRPSEKNKKSIRKYEEEVGVRPIPGKGVAEGGGLKIVWGMRRTMQMSSRQSGGPIGCSTPWP